MNFDVFTGLLKMFDDFTDAGSDTPNIKDNSMALLDYSYQKGKDYGINCRCHAIILTECLLAIGIPARIIYIMPCSPYDEDNHVITHAFVRELNKWIMLDPSFDCYVKNKEDEILDIFEIRESLSNREYIMHNRLENINKIEYKYAAPKEPLKIPNIKNKRVYHGNSI